MDYFALAETARLVRNGYPEAARAWCAERQWLEGLNRRDDATPEELAEARRTFQHADARARDWARMARDVAEACRDRLPDLWPTVPLLADAYGWHERSDFDWPGALAELRRVEAEARRRDLEGRAEAEALAVPLSPRALTVLATMYTAGLVDRDHWLDWGRIVKNALGGNADSARDVRRELAAAGMVAARRGKGGGLFLTPAGIRRAQRGGG